MYKLCLSQRVWKLLSHDALRPVRALLEYNAWTHAQLWAVEIFRHLSPVLQCHNFWTCRLQNDSVFTVYLLNSRPYGFIRSLYSCYGNRINVVWPKSERTVIFILAEPSALYTMGEVYVGFFLVVLGKNNKGLVYPKNSLLSFQTSVIYFQLREPDECSRWMFF